MHRGGRPLSGGEIDLLRTVYADRIDYPRVRIHARRWFWPLPNDRPMAPNGHAYFPGDTYEPDFAAATVPLTKRGTFVHEGAHLYQWHGLGQTVWLRGPFDRTYDYALEPGRAYERYGLEQMGMIAEHYYVLRSGGRIRPPYALADYRTLLPLRPQGTGLSRAAAR